MRVLGYGVARNPVAGDTSALTRRPRPARASASFRDAPRTLILARAMDRWPFHRDRLGTVIRSQCCGCQRREV